MSYTREQIEAKHQEIDAELAEAIAEAKAKKRALLGELLRIQEQENAEAELAAAQAKVDAAEQTIVVDSVILDTLFGNVG